ncbi:MAG: RNA polymerase sigma-54 factor, partial [Acidobacteria bacterium]
MPYLEQKLQPKLSQRLIITPQLQQAIRLLQLSKLDLQQEISQELVENPALEEAGTRLDENSTSPADSAPADREVTAGENADRSEDDFDYASFFRDLEDSYQPTRGMRENRSADELPSLEQVVSSGHGLAEHLQWQLEMTIPDGKLRRIGEAIIGNLDERGYLEATDEELAAMAPEGDTWSPGEIARVRETIRRFDPVGVASRDLAECLLTQLEVAGLSESKAAVAIRDHLDLLERHRDDELRDALDVDETELV